MKAIFYYVTYLQNAVLSIKFVNTVRKVRQKIWIFWALLLIQKHFNFVLCLQMASKLRWRTPSPSIGRRTSRTPPTRRDTCPSEEKDREKETRSVFSSFSLVSCYTFFFDGITASACCVCSIFAHYRGSYLMWSLLDRDKVITLIKRMITISNFLLKQSNHRYLWK